MTSRNGDRSRSWSRFAVIVTALVVCVATSLAAAELSKVAVSQFKLGWSYYESGRLPEAMGAVDKALKEEPKYAQAHLLRGMILDRRGATEDALAEFDRALDLDKKYTDARLYRGAALARLERREDAMKEFEIALKDQSYAYPEKVHTNIGWLKRMESDYHGAIESLEAAIKINPSHARAYFELGVTYDALGKDAEALRAYQDALVGMDGSPDLHLKLGLAMIKSGSHAKARQHLEKVLALSPEGPQAEEARGAIATLSGPHKPS